MRRFLSIWSFIANPLFVPSLVSYWYFIYVSFYEGAQIQNVMYLILIFTAAIPLLIYSLLKLFRAVESIHLSTTKERITPLIAYILLLLILLRTTFVNREPSGLYYFFIGVLLATVVATVLSALKYKISLHMMALGGAMGFVLVLTLILGIPFLYQLIFLSLLAGITGSSRLVMKAHRGHELVFGLATGFVCQIVSGSYLAQLI